METKRCFVAVDLPSNVINEIKRIQKQIQQKNLFMGKITTPGNLHLTLKFLGEIDKNKIDEVKQMLKEIRFNSFEGKIGGKQVQAQLGGKQVQSRLGGKQVQSRLGGKQVQAQLGEIGVFSKKLPRIIWIKLEGKIFDLQKEVDEVLSGLFESEYRFMSHITIARIKQVYNKKEFVKYLGSIKYEKMDFKIEEFFLMESELTAEGPVYKKIKKYNLES